jgi:hypothetical protein
MEYSNLRELVKESEKTVAIFTKGIYLLYRSDGTGYSGIWVINPGRLEGTKKVVVYLRPEGATVNQLYIGDYVGIRLSHEERRYYIDFANYRPAGTTEKNWLQFAAMGQSPIVVINK